MDELNNVTGLVFRNCRANVNGWIICYRLQGKREEKHVFTVATRDPSVTADTIELAWSQFKVMFDKLVDETEKTQRELERVTGLSFVRQHNDLIWRHSDLCDNYTLKHPIVFGDWGLAKRFEYDELLVSGENISQSWQAFKKVLKDYASNLSAESDQIRRTLG